MANTRDRQLLAAIDELSLKTAQLRLTVLGRFHPGNQWEEHSSRLLAHMRAQLDLIDREIAQT